MLLKDYLTKTLDKQLKDANQRVANLTAAISGLNDLDVDHALYRVFLRSMWSDHGEKEVILSHTGSLAKAIALAEAKFMRVNERTDVQADYFIAVAVGNVWEMIPEKYWQELPSGKRRKLAPHRKEQDVS